MVCPLDTVEGSMAGWKIRGSGEKRDKEERERKWKMKVSQSDGRKK